MRIVEEIKELEKQKRELEAKRGGMVGTMSAEQIRAENKLVQDYGKTQIEKLGRGENETERLQATVRGLDQMIRRQSQLASAATDENTRRREGLLLLQAQVERQNVQLRLIELQAKLETERYNKAKEMEREFNRNALTAGPADLLRRIAVKQLDAKGSLRSVGGFMAMDEGSRRIAQELPDYNPQIAEMDRQLRTLRNLPNMSQFLNYNAGMDLDKDITRRRYLQPSKQALDASNLDVISPKAAEVSAAFATLRTGASEAASALASIPSVIQNLVQNAVSVAMATVKSYQGDINFDPTAGSKIGAAAIA
jgi:hypothetical protein